MDNRKATGVVLVTLGAVLLLTAVAALLSARFGGQRYGDAAAPYPYSCTEKKDGTVALTLRSGDGNAAWSAGETGGAAEVVLGATKRGKASATLMPATEGRGELRFALRRGTETLAEVRLTVETRETERGTLALAVVSHSERVMQDSLSGGEETGHPFSAYADDTGALLLRIADPSLAALLAEEAESASEELADTAELWRWTVRSGNPAVLNAAITDVDEAGLTVRVEPEADGQADVAVSCAAAELTYVFSVLSQGGTARVADWRAEAAASTPDGTVEEAGGADDAPAENAAAPVTAPEPAPVSEETDENGDFLLKTEPEPGQPETSDVPYAGDS